MSDDPKDPEPTGRSRYEDFDLSTPPPVAPARRTPTLTVAGIVLAFSGVYPLITVFLVHVGPTASIALGVLGVLELTGAALVLLLHPLGRPMGIALGCLGLIIGLLSARTSPANGLVSMFLNGFVIYALASSGPVFRRR
jgi:hypothetical protein